MFAVIHRSEMVETQQLRQSTGVDLVALVAFPHGLVFSWIAHHQFADVRFSTSRTTRRPFLALATRRRRSQGLQGVGQTVECPFRGQDMLRRQPVSTARFSACKSIRRALLLR